MCWVGRFGFAVFPRWLAWRWWQPWHRDCSIHFLRVGPLMLGLADAHGWWDEA